MSTFKVIDTSNFGLETVADILVEEGFATEAEAQARADKQNEGRSQEFSPYWAEAVPASRRLWRGVEDLV